MLPTIDSLIRGQEPVTVSEDATALDAARRMSEEVVGCVVVVDAAGRATGIVTDRDLAIRVGARHGASAADSHVRDVASSPLIHVPHDEDLNRAIDRMRVRGVRRIVVTDEAGRPTGILNLDDVLEILSRHLYELARDTHVGLQGSGRDARLSRLREDVEEALDGVVARLQRANWLARETLVQEVGALRERLRKSLG